MNYFIVISLGLVLGSYFNVVIFRSPGDIDLHGSRSQCPKCKATLSIIDLIPILSWILLKGKCRYCNSRISIQYPLVELASAILGIIAYEKYGFYLEAVLHYFFMSICLIIALTDLRTQMIPDKITIPAMIAFLLAASFRTSAIPQPFSVTMKLTLWVNLLVNSLIGVVACGGFLWLLAELSGGKMGGGDIKFMAAVGAYMGWYSGMMVLLLGSIFGIIVTYTLIMLGKAKKGQLIPFGPYLAAAGIILSNIPLYRFF